MSRFTYLFSDKFQYFEKCAGVKHLKNIMSDVCPLWCTTTSNHKFWFLAGFFSVKGFCLFSFSPTILIHNMDSILPWNWWVLKSANLIFFGCKGMFYTFCSLNGWISSHMVGNPTTALCWPRCSYNKIIVPWFPKLFCLGFQNYSAGVSGIIGKG